MGKVGLFESKDAKEIARAIVAEKIAPDAAVGWARRVDGEWAHGVGICSEAGAPIFDLASLTKPMTAVAIARSRALAWETKLGEVVASVSATASAEASIELLVGHRAGLAAHVELHRPLLEGKAVDYEASIVHAAGLRREECSGPMAASGFPRLYSDSSYILAGEALRIAEGTRDAGEAIERNVVAAIGCERELGTSRSLRALMGEDDFMKRVRPTEDVAWRGGLVRGYVHDEDAFALTRDGASGHAGMFGTVNGVLEFGKLALDCEAAWGGFDSKSPTGSSAGEIAGARAFGHLGFTGTSIWIDPDVGVVVVCLTNRVCPSRSNIAIRAARPEIHDALFRLALRT